MQHLLASSYCDCLLVSTSRWSRQRKRQWKLVVVDNRRLASFASTAICTPLLVRYFGRGARNIKDVYVTHSTEGRRKTARAKKDSWNGKSLGKSSFIKSETARISELYTFVCDGNVPNSSVDNKNKPASWPLNFSVVWQKVWKGQSAVK